MFEETLFLLIFHCTVQFSPHKEIIRRGDWYHNTLPSHYFVLMILSLWFCPYYSVHIILSILFWPYLFVHISLTISFCPYHFVQIILSMLIFRQTLPQLPWCGGTASCSGPWSACGSSAAGQSSPPPPTTDTLAADSTFFDEFFSMNFYSMKKF